MTGILYSAFIARRGCNCVRRMVKAAFVRRFHALETKTEPHQQEKALNDC